MAEHRRAGVVNQRTLAGDPDPAPAELPPSPPSGGPEPLPPDAPETSPPRAYAPVVSSSDALWERKLRWLSARARAEAVRDSDPAPPPEK